MRQQIAYEMQNVAFGPEAGFKYISSKDPQVKKALEVIPDAEKLLKKKLLTYKLKGDGKTVAMK